MWSDRSAYFSALAKSLVGTYPRPVVLLDWTKCDNMYALVAAVPVGGRAIPIYLEVHPEKLLGHHRVHRLFLKALRKILPAQCCPILVTDAGFQGPFFLEVLRFGWNFVGRLRGTGKSRTALHGWLDLADFYARATIRPKSFGFGQLYRKHPSLKARLVLVRSTRRATPHPWQRKRTGKGSVHRSIITGSKDPWLLATSLPDRSSRIVKIYSKRMQIEETFRDTKNSRFGWALRLARSNSRQRLQTLLLLSVLAMAAVSLLGAAAVLHGRHRRYQANTTKKRVFSDFVLGTELLKRNDVLDLFPLLRSALDDWRSVLLEFSE
jgi:Transposase DDE domain